ncbi:YncE family protein, partial [Mycobacterium tuberculosis]
VTGLVFVTNFDSNTVSVIDPTTNTVTGSPITVGTAPTGVAVNPVTGEVYVTNFAGDTVSVIS